MMTDSTKPLADRIALVTGASRGIGAALALQLAEAGAHVVAVARTVGGLEELDDKIKGSRWRRDAGAARHEGYRWDPAPRARAQRALRPARRADRQCRPADRPLAGRTYRSERLGQRHRRQPHGQLAPDPRVRPSAQGSGGRPRRFYHLGGRLFRAPLFRALRRVQSRRSISWCAPTPPNAKTAKCGSTCSARARRARG